MKAIQKVLAFTVLSMSASVFAAPLPASIVVEDKAVVPVLKTEVIRKAAGQEPVREVQATVFEVTNNGKDIVLWLEKFSCKIIKLSFQTKNYPRL